MNEEPFSIDAVRHLRQRMREEAGKPPRPTYYGPFHPLDPMVAYLRSVGAPEAQIQVQDFTPNDTESAG